MFYNYIKETSSEYSILRRGYSYTKTELFNINLPKQEKIMTASYLVSRKMVGHKWTCLISNITNGS